MLKHSSNSVCLKWTHACLEFLNPQFSFTLMNGTTVTIAVSYSSLKRSRYFKFLLSSLLHYSIHNSWSVLPLNIPRLTSLHPRCRFLKTLQWFTVVFRIKFILFKVASKIIISSSTMSPPIPWPSLCLSNLSSLCSPLGLWLAALSSWFSFPVFYTAGFASLFKSSVKRHIFREASSDHLIWNGPSDLILTTSWEYFVPLWLSCMFPSLL